MTQVVIFYSNTLSSNQVSADTGQCDPLQELHPSLLLLQNTVFHQNARNPD